MRRLAAALGVAPMAPYRHVTSKDDLLDGMVDVVFAEIDLVAGAAGWKAAMRARAVSVRDVLTRHRWAIPLMESRTTPGPANLAHREAVLTVLLGGGFSAAGATHALNLLDSYIYGFALQEANLPFSDAEELAEVGQAILEHIPADAYPNLVAVAGELMAAGFDYGAEFTYGLDVVLDGIERSHG